MSLIRDISRNAVVRKIVPYSVQLLLWDIVLKSKGRKLRTGVMLYYKNRSVPNSKTRAAIDYLKKYEDGFYTDEFLNIWLESDSYFNFNGAKLPDISKDSEKMNALKGIFQDTFFFSCMLNDDYDKSIVELFDPLMMEGPYGYKNDNFDVTIKEKDLVIDAGAWIGDFSAYAASKGAISYAFEPIGGNFKLLTKTADLNGGGRG